MGNLPLHPALVHLPLGLAFVIPLLALSLTVAMWRGWLPGRAWALLVGLQAVLLLGGMVAMNTGEKEEEQVERVVAESAIEAHEDAAKQFMLGTGVVLVLAGAGLFLSEQKRRVLALAVSAGTLAVAGLGVRVGHAGGELVYTHGAASAYVSTPVGVPSGGPASSASGRGPRGEPDED